MLTALVLLAALGCAVNGGFYLAFSACVMAALARMPPLQGAAAMKLINVTVLNRWFMTVFFGAPLACLAAAGLALADPPPAGALACVLAAAVLQVGLSFVLTMRCNVPLNDGLAAADLASPAGQELWTRYLRVWTRWNHVRTAASLAAAALLLLAPSLAEAGHR